MVKNSKITPRGPQKVLAISSGGGHWIQLKRLLPAFSSCQVVFVSEHKSYEAETSPSKFYSICQATRMNRVKLIRQALSLCWILLKERPDVIISTGTSCGFIAFLLAKLLLKSRTIWVDSIANAETLSLSGKLAKPLADLCLTQWAHLAEPDGPYYKGSVL